MRSSKWCCNWRRCLATTTSLACIAAETYTEYILSVYCLSVFLSCVLFTVMGDFIVNDCHSAEKIVVRLSDWRAGGKCSVLDVNGRASLMRHDYWLYPRQTPGRHRQWPPHVMHCIEAGDMRVMRRRRFASLRQRKVIAAVNYGPVRIHNYIDGDDFE